ncbi:MAG TPA: hypothetical protein V6D20_24125 [Candidatus Obscuribacterales bacterium]
MAALKPLQGVDLISCAQANARLGLKVAAQQCGYGENTDQFGRVLQDTCRDMGIDISQLSDLLTDRQS